MIARRSTIFIGMRSCSQTPSTAAEPPLKVAREPPATEECRLNAVLALS